MLGIAFSILMMATSIYGSWFYYRAIGGFPGEPVYPVEKGLRRYLAFIDFTFLLFVPPMIILGASPSLWVSYYVGRLVIPAIVPPGRDMEHDSIIQSLLQTSKNFVFDHFFAKIAVLIFVVGIPQLMQWLAGPPEWLELVLSKIAALLPPPQLIAFDGFAPQKLALSGWFYASLMFYLTFRFVLQLGVHRAVLASICGVLLVAKIDLIAGSVLNLDGGYLPSPADLGFAVGGFIVASILDVLRVATHSR